MEWNDGESIHPVCNLGNAEKNCFPWSWTSWTSLEKIWRYLKSKRVQGFNSGFKRAFNRSAGEFPGRFACARWMRRSTAGQGQFHVFALLRMKKIKNFKVPSCRVLSHPFTSLHPLTDDWRFLKFQLGKSNTLCVNRRVSCVASCVVSGVVSCSGLGLVARSSAMGRKDDEWRVTSASGGGARRIWGIYEGSTRSAPLIQMYRR